MMLQAFKRTPLWSIAIALMVVAQLALAFHGVDHKFDPAPPLGDHCALCQVASAMAPGPAADPIAAPTLHELTQVAPPSVPQPRILPSPAGFRSRAPPAVVSV